MTRIKHDRPRREAVTDPSMPLTGMDTANPRDHAPILDFPIGGIGASAGGLAAFEAFFSSMPKDVDTGMAFVLVQHLTPDHESILGQHSRAEIPEAHLTRRIAKNGDVIKVSIISCTLINKEGKLYAIATTERAIHGDGT